MQAKRRLRTFSWQTRACLTGQSPLTDPDPVTVTIHVSGEWDRALSNTVVRRRWACDASSQGSLSSQCLLSQTPWCIKYVPLNGAGGCENDFLASSNVLGLTDTVPSESIQSP